MALSARRGSLSGSPDSLPCVHPTVASRLVLGQMLLSLRTTAGLLELVHAPTLDTFRELRALQERMDELELATLAVRRNAGQSWQDLAESVGEAKQQLWRRQAKRVSEWVTDTLGRRSPERHDPTWRLNAGEKEWNELLDRMQAQLRLLRLGPPPGIRAQEFIRVNPPPGAR